MLNTVQELENEIELFHKNIKDSNDLMKILMSLTEITKKQTEAFNDRTRELTDEIGKIPPEMNEIVKEKVELFRLALQQDYQSFQQSVKALFDNFSSQLDKAEKAIIDIPSVIEEKSKLANESHLREIEKLNAELSKDLEKENEAFNKECQSNQEFLSNLLQNFETNFSVIEKKFEAIPSMVDEQNQNFGQAHLTEINRINLEYSNALSKMNVLLEEQIGLFAKKMLAIPGSISENVDAQNKRLVSELTSVLEEHTNQAVQLDKHMTKLVEQLGEKYDAFVEKLESTNMDQLYKYCQDMNKSISIKLGLALGGVGLAVIISIIALFI